MPHPPATRSHRDHVRTERSCATRWTTALLALALLLAACGGTPPPGGGGPGGGGPGDDDPPALATSVRIVLEPAGFILPGAGSTQRLTAIVVDDAGQPTDVEVTWEVDDPAAATVAADGTVTALSEVGSVQVVARAGTLASAPALGVIAPLAEGAVPVSDAQVVALEEVDAAADFGLGWRYGAVLTGVAPLAPGDLIVGTGMTPLGGRVVTVETTAGGQRVTLELVDLDELFTDLRIETELAIDPADLLVDPELLDDYDVQRLADGTLRFVPRADLGTSSLAPAADDGKFQLGPFTCTTDDVALPGLSLASPPKIEVTPKIDFVLEYDRSKGGLQRIGLKGSLRAKISYEPRFGAFFEATLKCTRELATWTLPIGGPWRSCSAPRCRWASASTCRRSSPSPSSA